ncbi:hypothetical protein [Shimia ponticola]|uniref:hypothetical protein n=1 Tax=Shimia ponticola TaxID=2582893 RepID=UPI00164AAEC6|nr:hypothetical protein [Shimia ponticola]
MSAPDTNTDRQIRRHRGPIYGIAVGLGAVAIMWYVFAGMSGDTVDVAPDVTQEVADG